MFEQADSEDDAESDALYEHENLLNAMVSNLQSQNGPIWKIKGIRCAAHSLQLCTNSALDNMSKANKNVITICRRIAKTMRLKSTINELRSNGIEYNLPKLDVETRWCSKYTMVIIYIFYFK